MTACEFGNRHRWIGGLLTAAAMLLLGAPAGDGPALAIAPAVIGALAVGGGILKGLGGRRKNPKLWRAPRGRLDYYGGMEESDIRRLHEGRLEGPGLGFSQGEMEARSGPERSEAEAQYKGNLAGLEQGVAGSNLGRLSGAYFRGKQRAAAEHLSRMSDIRRRNLLAGAFQRRSDLYNRLSATGGALARNVGYYNASRLAQTRASDATKQAYLNTAGGAMSALAGSMGGMGGFGGAGGIV
jgi:hypothetical protein